MKQVPSKSAEWANELRGRSPTQLRLSVHAPSSHYLCVHEPFSEPRSSAVKASKV